MENLTSPKPSELIRYVPKYTLIHYITYAETFFMRISITDLASLARSIFIINVPTYAYIKIRILYIYTGLRIRIRSDPVFLHGSGFQISLDPDPVFKFFGSGPGSGFSQDSGKLQKGL